MDNAEFKTKDTKTHVQTERERIQNSRQKIQRYREREEEREARISRYSYA
jgi:hypothetical protein